MPSAKCQLQICVPLTSLDLTPRRRSSIVPRNALACLIARLDLQSPAGESVAEYRAHVVPDIGVVDVVGEYQLAGVGSEETAWRGGDFQGDTTRLGVRCEHFAI